MDANALLNVQRGIAGDNQTTLSTIDVLSSLKSIDYFQKQPDGADTSLATQLARNELKYLESAMEAVTDNPLLRMKFGDGLQGSMAVAGLLKQRNAETLYNDI